MAFFEEAAETITTEVHNFSDMTLNQCDGTEGIEFYFDVPVNNFFLIIYLRAKNLYNEVNIFTFSHVPTNYVRPLTTRK